MSTVFFQSCSNFLSNSDKKSASVRYSLDSRAKAKINSGVSSYIQTLSRNSTSGDDTTSEDDTTSDYSVTLFLELCGDYEDSASISFEEGEGSVSFEGVPVGSLIYANAYVKVSAQDTEYVAYEGSSDAFTVTSGINQVSLILKKTEEGSGSEEDIEVDAVFYVSASIGNDQTGDGSESYPYASISKAVASFTDDEATYMICVDGALSSPQTISPDSTSDGTIHAGTIILAGLSSSASDYIDAGLSSETAEEDYASALTVSTEIPLYIKNFGISGGYTTNGAGLYLESGSSVILASGAVIQNNTATDYGGGVYVSPGATLVIEDDSQICGNTAYVGGGIYITGDDSESSLFASVTMNGGIINSNIETSTYDEGPRGGGAVCIYGSCAAFYLYGGQIYSNTASAYGGAFSVLNSATLCMYEGMIGGEDSTYANKSEDDSGGYGGAVYIADSGIFNMEGGSIMYNTSSATSSAGGGGVCAFSGTFKMTDGKIYGNSSAFTGGGVYVGSTGIFYLNGGSIAENTCTKTYGTGVYIKYYNESYGAFHVLDGSVDESNNVYLPDGATITIEGQPSEDNLVAVIYPETYIPTTSTSIFEFTDGLDKTAEDVFYKFPGK
ncbi:hypothetical protein [Treponema sp.]|uniref:hypothetical protein n=1 Tax=Treponema sp. TaxID=166 RepID=UPI0025FD36C7|nr:hypothetical protein [Treponema sp.]MCR5218992.1 hypothetical protein [Treponema sp.]